MPKLRLQNIRKQRGGEIAVNKKVLMRPHTSRCHVASLTLGTRSQAEVSNLSKFDYGKGRLTFPWCNFLILFIFGPWSCRLEFRCVVLESSCQRDMEKWLSAVDASSIENSIPTARIRRRTFSWSPQRKS